MSVSTSFAPPKTILYPESDGQPMADHTLQFLWIVLIKENLEALFCDDETVFVAGDLLWYAVEGDNRICQAPDVLVVFGRPKGHRGSYRQWEEEGIAPQVVFEVLSRSNRHGQMINKFRFYDEYGVEEYYLYDPENRTLEGWLRRGGSLKEIPTMHGWVSPRLRVRFEWYEDAGLKLFGPDGSRFLTFVELAAQRKQAEQRADTERLARQQAQQRADTERLARQQAQQRADEAQQRAERLAAQLRALGVDPDAGG
jgi:Uma2 family endonuclease